MIGIQGETALDEVTKSPADAALSTTSTNSVQNKVVTGEINDIKADLINITKIHTYEASGTSNSSGVVSLPSALSGKKVLSIEVYGTNSSGASAIGLGNIGCRLVTVNANNGLVALSATTVALRWTYID